jgi:aspartyl-tRNA(Asn)/glutamyl-tRNA(Gln) amidotransferase subunit B
MNDEEGSGDRHRRAPLEREVRTVVGLEVHAQLITESKAYSSDPNAYGDHPNTNVSVVTLGIPGTLPVPNKKGGRTGRAHGPGHELHHRAADALRAQELLLPRPAQGLPDHAGHHADLHEGAIRHPDHARSGDSAKKRIGITRIHMEEDAGKSIHDVDPFNTLVDLNRAGVPLVEIVSEPDIRSGQEAYDYLVEIRRLVRYLDICDGNMEEGSLRCDANISLRPKG